MDMKAYSVIYFSTSDLDIKLFLNSSYFSVEIGVDLL